MAELHILNNRMEMIPTVSRTNPLNVWTFKRIAVPKTSSAIPITIAKMFATKCSEPSLKDQIVARENCRCMKLMCDKC